MNCSWVGFSSIWGRIAGGKGGGAGWTGSKIITTRNYTCDIIPRYSVSYMAKTGCDEAVKSDV